MMKIVYVSLPLLLLMTKAWAWSPGPVNSAAMTDLTVDTSDRNDVLSFYQHVYLQSEDYASVMNWTGSHSAQTPGTNSQIFVDKMRRRVNYYRALAGLPANITMNTASTVVTQSDPYSANAATTKATAAQAAALLISYNNTLTHNPATNAPCFTSAAGNGSYFGNIAIGTYGPASIDAYMTEDANNLDVGHRRWLLYTLATDFATGDIPRTASKNPANTIYVRQRSDELAPYIEQFIPWPNAGYCPWKHASAYWSLSYPGADFSTATVAVTKNGIAQSVSSIRANPGYGNNSLSWYVAGVPTSGADTTYTVTVSEIGGGGPTTYSYSTTFFNPDVLLTVPTLVGSQNITTAGENYSLSGIDVAEEYRLEVAKKVNSTWTEGAEDPTATQVIEAPQSSYSVRQTAIKRSGSKAFRLGFSDVAQTLQWVELDRVMLPQAGSTIQYYLRRGFMLPSTTFAIQYSLDDGGSWQDVTGSSIAGNSTNNVTESIFATKACNFPAATINQPTRLRLSYRKSSGAGEFLVSQHAEVGAFIDDISFGNCDWLSERSFTTYLAGTSQVALSSASAGAPLVNGTIYSMRVQPRIANSWMAASPIHLVTVGTVIAENHSPTLNAINNPTAILENAGIQTIALTGVSDGDGQTQAITISASSSNPTLIPHPSVLYTSPNTSGILQYQPLADAAGSAVITVTVADGSLSVSRTFTVVVTNVNNAPRFGGLSDLTINEDSNSGLIPLTLIDPDSPIAAIKTTITSNNPTLIPLKNVVITGKTNSRTMKITPAINRSGTAIITLKTTDKIATTTQTFTVTVNEVNDAPLMKTVFKAIAVKEDSVIKPIAFSGVSAGPFETQVLSMTATSSNPSIIAHPVVNYNSPATAGSLALRCMPNATGTAIITVTINDGGATNATLVRSFSVTVKPINDAPTISAISAQLVTKSTTSAPIPFTVADPETAANSLHVTAVSSNTKLIATANISLGGSGADRYVRVTPITNATGTATITVTVKDEKLIATTKFLVTVAAQNSAPTISDIADVSIDMNEELGPLAFTVHDPENQLDQLIVAAVSDNPTLLPNANIHISGSGNNRTISATPVTNQAGTAVITITVDDGGGENATATRTFTLTVNQSIAPSHLTEPYASWVSTHYPQLLEDGFAADLDEDGLSNGTEYALNLDPTEPSIAGTLAMDPVSETLQLSIPLLAKKQDMVYAAEYSADGVNWSADGVTVSYQNGTLTAHVSGSAQGQLRWKISIKID